jgi:hypothetical protein
MSHVFISYDRKDTAFAEVLKRELEGGGFNVWMDTSGLRAGSEWSQEIDHNIRTAMALVVIITPDSVASSYVSYEWSYALGAGVHVIPVLRRRAETHLRLSRLHNFNFCGSARPWRELIEELKSIEAARSAVV